MIRKYTQIYLNKFYKIELTHLKTYHYTKVIQN